MLVAAALLVREGWLTEHGGAYYLGPRATAELDFMLLESSEKGVCSFCNKPAMLTEDDGGWPAPAALQRLCAALPTPAISLGVRTPLALQAGKAGGTGIASPA